MPDFNCFETNYHQFSPIRFVSSNDSSILAFTIYELPGSPIIMHAHIFQHVHFEGIGSMANWFSRNKVLTTATRFFDGETACVPDRADMLVVMGGPMSVHDEREFPWLIGEKRAIERSIAAGIPVLGICLGAQLIATVAGAKVHKNHEREIGWWPIESTPQANGFKLRDGIVFHWHGETFDLPSGATHLASSQACRNQAFELAGRTIGLQFHLETTPVSAAELVCHARQELVPGKFVQDELTILGASATHYETLLAEMDRLLAYMSANNPRK